jgi:hypothetical protein
MKRARRSRLGLLSGLLLLLPWAVSPGISPATAQTLNQPVQTAKPTANPASDAPPPLRQGLEPKAIAILQAASARLASARSLRFTAVTTYESPSRLGTPLAYMSTSEITLQRPNRLRVLTLGDGPASEFYYDGKAITAFAPAENLVAVAAAPPTIDAMLKMAYDSAAIYFPFTDFIVSDPYKDLSESLELAFYVGRSQIVGGTTTDIIAISNGSVFAQIWIGANDQLPRLIRAVYADDPSRLRHQTEFLNWQLNSTVTAESFTSSKAKKAKPIPFRHPDAAASATGTTKSP